MHRLVTLASIAGMACAANAQVVHTQFTYEVSHDGVIWSPTIGAMPGNEIQVRVLASYVGSTSAPTAGGLGAVVFQPVVTNWNPQPGGDVLMTTAGTPGGLGVGPVGGTRSTPIGTVSDTSGTWGRISPFGANVTTTSTYLRGFVGSGTSANLMRIARADVTNWIGEGSTSGAGAYNNTNGGGGVSIAQISNPNRLLSDPAFNASTENVVIFKFGFVVGQHDAGTDVEISTLVDGFGRGYSWVGPTGETVLLPSTTWFADADEASPSINGTILETAAHVLIVPAPGAIGILAGLLISARRQRG